MSLSKCPTCETWHPHTRCPVCRAAERRARGGPGTELEKIIPEFFSQDGCPCKSYARVMDRWGVDGCERRFARIVNHLTTQAENVFIVKHLGPINRVVAARWVRMAINHARAIDAARSDAQSSAAG